MYVCVWLNIVKISTPSLFLLEKLTIIECAATKMCYAMVFRHIRSTINATKAKDKPI